MLQPRQTHRTQHPGESEATEPRGVPSRSRGALPGRKAMTTAQPALESSRTVCLKTRAVHKKVPPEPITR
eukprot:2106954-Pyramimonas_sp.AAC.1